MQTKQNHNPIFIKSLLNWTASPWTDLLVVRSVPEGMRCLAFASVLVAKPRPTPFG